MSSCSRVQQSSGVKQSKKAAWLLHWLTLNVEALHSFETSITIYQPTGVTSQNTLIFHTHATILKLTHFQNYILDLLYVFLICCDDSLIKIVNLGYMEGSKEERKWKERKNKEGEKKGVLYEFHVPDGQLNSGIQDPLICANFCSSCSYCRPQTIWHHVEGEEFWRKQTNLPGVNQFMKNPGKDSQPTEYFSWDIIT